MMSKVAITIKDGDIDIRGGCRAIGMACTWHPAAKPGQVNFQLLGKVYRGIYSVDGDTLKICWSTGRGAARPAKFEKGTDQVLVIVRRER